MSDDTTPSRRAAGGYDHLAARAESEQDPAGSLWGDSHFQRFYAWPASRETLPDVRGRRVLIAGCGRGDHVGWFLDRGATVVGVDVSERALDAARDRFGDDGAEGATFRRADLAEPLDFGDGTFDLAFGHLVLGHVREWGPVFAEFERVLTPGGSLVVTVVHPAYLRRRKDVERYYDVEEFRVSVPGVDIPTFYRPPSAMLAPLLDAGFALEAFVEPEPLDALADHDPERYADATESPEVLCLRATSKEPSEFGTR